MNSRTMVIAILTSLTVLLSATAYADTISFHCYNSVDDFTVTKQLNGQGDFGSRNFHGEIAKLQNGAIVSTYVDLYPRYPLILVDQLSLRVEESTCQAERTRGNCLRAESMTNAVYVPFSGGTENHRFFLMVSGPVIDSEGGALYCDMSANIARAR